MKRYVRQVKFSKDPLKSVLHYSRLDNALCSRKKITAVTCSMITQIRYNKRKAFIIAQNVLAHTQIKDLLRAYRTIISQPCGYDIIELRQRDFPNRRAALGRSHHQLCGCISVNILNSLNRVPDGQNSFFKVDVFPFQRTKLTYTDTSSRR